MPESAVLDAPLETPAVSPPTENGSTAVPASSSIPENPLDALKVLAKPVEPAVVPTEPAPVTPVVSPEPAVARFVAEEVPTPAPAIDAYQGPGAMDVLNNGLNGENKAVKFKLRSGEQAAENGERMLALGTDTKDPHRLIMPEHTDSSIDSSNAANVITFAGKPEGLFNTANGQKIENGTVLQLGSESVKVVNFNPETSEIILQKEKSQIPEVAPLPQPEAPPQKTEVLQKSNTRKKLIPWLVSLAAPLVSVVGGNPEPVSAPAMPEIHILNPPAQIQTVEFKVPEVLQQTLDKHYPKEGDSFQGFVKHRLGKGIAELVAKVKDNPNGDPEAARVAASLSPEMKRLAENIAEKENKNLRPVDPDDPDLQKLVQDFLAQEKGVPIYERMANLFEKSIEFNNPGKEVMKRKEDGDFSLSGGEFKSGFSGPLFQRAAGEILTQSTIAQGSPPAPAAL